MSQLNILRILNVSSALLMYSLVTFPPLSVINLLFPFNMSSPLPSNYMWHTDWSELNGKQYIAFIDDRSRKIMAGGEFTNATAENAIFLLHLAILTNEVSPVIVLSDKGSQFYANIRMKSGEKGISQCEDEIRAVGIDFWTSRRNHPQTKGKMEKWFDTIKKKKKKHPDESFQGFIKWYNEKRIHHALEYKTPEEVYQEKL
ncbi:transposase [Candidatus Woesearchaeota archaeon]|nr:transposase [Candidatus Woesearchaeota archaeon]